MERVAPNAITPFVPQKKQDFYRVITCSIQNVLFNLLAIIPEKDISFTLMPFFWNQKKHRTKSSLLFI